MAPFQRRANGGPLVPTGPAGLFQRRLFRLFLSLTSTQLHPAHFGDVAGGGFADAFQERKALTGDLKKLAVVADIVDIGAGEKLLDGAVPLRRVVGIPMVDELLAVGLDFQRGTDLDPADVGLEILARLEKAEVKPNGE